MERAKAKKKAAKKAEKMLSEKGMVGKVFWKI